MLFWDVTMEFQVLEGKKPSISAIKRAMEIEPNLKVTLLNHVDDDLLENNLKKKI
jgi:urocanate hydratase